MALCIVPGGGGPQWRMQDLEGGVSTRDPHTAKGYGGALYAPPSGFGAEPQEPMLFTSLT